jgi:DnaJ family protein C protein 28
VTTPPSPSHAPDSDGGPRNKDPRHRWASAVDEQIRHAMERGDFANLPGAGRPLHIDENPFAGSRALAYSLLKSHHVLPRELELGREIETQQAQVEAQLARLRWHRDQLTSRRRSPAPSERRAYMVLRASVEAHLMESLRSLNSKILTLNISAPSLLHRPLIDIGERERSFRAEFPPLSES